MLLFLLEEHLRGPLCLAIERHNLLGGLRLDAIRVGDPTNLPLGVDDPDILVWAELQNRILITKDKHTLARHLANHLRAGRTSPGVLMLRPGRTITDILECLELIAHAGEPRDFANLITFIP
jgi:hypothetical protein